MNRLKQLRTARGLSLKEVANEVGIAESQLSFYENGKRKPRDEKTWQKLAEYFGVSVSYIMGLEENYLELGTKAYDELVNQYEKGAFGKNNENAFYNSLFYFDEVRKNELIIEACKKYGDGLKTEPAEITNGLLMAISDIFYTTYLSEAKSNENYLDFIEEYFLGFEEVLSDYPVVNQYSFSDPVHKNDYVHIIEYSGDVSLNLQKEVNNFFDEFKSNIHKLKLKYPNENHENWKDIHYWNKDNTSGLIGSIKQDEIKLFNDYTKDELLEILNNTNDQ